MHDIIDHNDQSCKGLEPALLSSVEELNQNALSVTLRGHFYNGNNVKHVGTDDLMLLALARKS